MIAADIILLSKNIFPAIDDDLISGGIAIKGNKIIALGNKTEMLVYQGDNTITEDFGDQLIIPGLCDSHVHFLMGCLYSCEVDLSIAKSEEEAARLVKEFHDHRHDKEKNKWIIGFSWYNNWWEDKAFPTKYSLDKYFPDRPVFLLNADGHAGWVNSKALEIAGIDKYTPDPDYGEIYRFDDGEPTGFLSEMAMSFCIKYAFDFSEAKERALIKNAMSEFNSYGLTSVNDMQNFFAKDLGNHNIYKMLEDSGELTLRINFATGLLKDPLYSLNLKHLFSDPEKKVYYNGGKEFIDGIINTHTALMLEKYSDDEEASIDFHLMDFDKAAENIKILHRNDINIHLHATGDGAVRKAIDFYEAAIEENGFTKSRLSIEHMDLTDEEDMPRMGKYELVASVQPEHVALGEKFSDNEYPGAVGPEREKHLWSFRSIMESGAQLAFGTDYPVAPLNPMFGLYQAVTRLFPDGEPIGGWNPQEKVSLATAIRAYTYGGAYKCGKENVLGTLSPGKLADITVLGKNLFELRSEEYLSCKAVMTMVNGEVVYRNNK